MLSMTPRIFLLWALWRGSDNPTPSGGGDELDPIDVSSSVVVKEETEEAQLPCWLEGAGSLSQPGHWCISTQAERNLQSGDKTRHISFRTQPRLDNARLCDMTASLWRAQLKESKNEQLTRRECQAYYDRGHSPPPLLASTSRSFQGRYNPWFQVRFILSYCVPKIENYGCSCKCNNLCVRFRFSAASVMNILFNNKQW